MNDTLINLSGLVIENVGQVALQTELSVYADMLKQFIRRHVIGIALLAFVSLQVHTWRHYLIRWFRASPEAGNRFIDRVVRIALIVIVALCLDLLFFAPRVTIPF